MSQFNRFYVEYVGSFDGHTHSFFDSERAVSKFIKYPGITVLNIYRIDSYTDVTETFKEE